jgi:hypothetical protein
MIEKLVGVILITPYYEKLPVGQYFHNKRV